ncbi:MerR family transcriptional regulator [Paenibacillus hexagrammi]|uniref:MerR family transcriptional regulator n=1 Tax=Paenibacillus hexagrammi TaxID=2908839 RepID=A0ABY3SPE2_9BACL|nr:MerR family transcriptional regulator [Paenibacillus sp. YPD9-1]UJF35005.1 MerR family transcriptional regulator [Paenibacillus sp. YPD9-1]
MDQMVYSVEEVAAKFQVTSRTLHYYEEIGLIPPIPRTDGGHRQYSQEIVERLDHILRIKRVLGVSLQEISAILEAENSLNELKLQYREIDSDEDKRSILLQSSVLLQSLVDSIQQKVSSLEKLKGSFEQRLDNVRDLLNQVK